MRRFTNHFSLVVTCGLIGISLWAVVSDLAMLIEFGRWFAVAGQFIAVFCTLVLGLLLVVVGLTATLLPVFAYFLIANPDYPMRDVGVRLYRVADGIWKKAWWAGWMMHRVMRGEGRAARPRSGE